MNCCLNLCNCENPHGCCHTDSGLFMSWAIPLSIITMPIWAPVALCVVCYGCVKETINNNIEWSDNHRGYGSVAT